MSKEELFALMWKMFVETGVLHENAAKTQKVLYKRSEDGYWVLRYIEGQIWLARPTLEELMLETIRGKGKKIED
jgi:hypothetical protein